MIDQRELNIATKNIAAIARRFEDKEVKKVIKRNTKPLIASAKANVPKRTGNLKRSIGNLALKRLFKAVLVGPRRGGGRKNDGWYGHFVEFGTVKIDKKPYMKPAWQQSGRKVLTGIYNDLRNQINKTRLRR